MNTYYCYETSFEISTTSECTSAFSQKGRVLSDHEIDVNSEEGRKELEDNLLEGYRKCSGVDFIEISVKYAVLSPFPYEEETRH